MQYSVETEGSDRGHLSAEQLIQLVEQGRRCPHYAEWIEHIVRCETCRTTYKYLLAAEQAVQEARRPVWRRWMVFGAPAAAAVATLLVLWVVYGSRPSPAGWQQAVHQVNGTTYEGAVRLPSWAADAVALLATLPPTVRAAGAFEGEIRLLTPDPANGAVDTLTPQFRWQAVPDAQGYFATLTPLAEGEAMVLKVSGTQAQLPPSIRLDAGQRYRLRIEARLPGGLPGSNPFCQYEFRTLTPAEQEQLRWARQFARRAPYASAMVFYRLGFYRESLATLPNDPSVQQWRDALSRQIASVDK
jgi:hypothetical protein